MERFKKNLFQRPLSAPNSSKCLSKYCRSSQVPSLMLLDGMALNTLTGLEILLVFSSSTKSSDFCSLPPVYGALRRVTEPFVS